MRENPFKSINLIMKGFPLPMKHTPLPPTAQAEATPLIEHVLTFFESVLLGLEPSASDGKPRRGAPPKLSKAHLWLACLLALLSQARGVAEIWRLLVLRPIGSFAPIRLTVQAVRARLLCLKLGELSRLLALVNQALTAQGSHRDALLLAPFAHEVVTLDESTLDAVARLCEDVEHLPASSPLLRVGKLAGLFDLRRQCWARLQFRSDALAHCKFGAGLLLEGLPQGSLILADLGYFGFPWFDYLTDQGYFWLSRLKQGVSFARIHTFYEQGETLDALIWLGASSSDQAAHAVRLVQFLCGQRLYQYVTNVRDPHRLSMAQVAQLYARRWDIELAFKLLKAHLGLRLWWGCDPHLLLLQLSLTLIVAQVLHHLQGEVAQEAGVDIFDVSLPVLLTLLLQASFPTPIGLVAALVEQGRFHQLIRPHSRSQPQAPLIEHQDLCPPPKGLRLWRQPRRTIKKKPRHPRVTSPFDFRLLPLFLI